MFSQISNGVLCNIIMSAVTLSCSESDQGNFFFCNFLTFCRVVPTICLTSSHHHPETYIWYPSSHSTLTFLISCYYIRRIEIFFNVVRVRGCSICNWYLTTLLNMRPEVAQPFLFNATTYYYCTCLWGPYHDVNATSILSTISRKSIYLSYSYIYIY